MDLAREARSLLQRCFVFRFERASFTAGKLTRSFRDSSLELIVAMLDLLLRGFQRGTLEQVPLSAPPGNHDVMDASRVEHIGAIDVRERIGAQKHHASVHDEGVKGLLELRDLAQGSVPAPGVLTAC